MKKSAELKDGPEVMLRRGTFSFSEVPGSTKYYIAITRYDRPGRRDGTDWRVLFFSPISTSVMQSENGIIKIRLRDLTRWNQRHIIRAGEYTIKIFWDRSHPKKPSSILSGIIDYKFTVSPGGAVATFKRYLASVADSNGNSSVTAPIRANEVQVNPVTPQNGENGSQLGGRNFFKQCLSIFRRVT